MYNEDNYSTSSETNILYFRSIKTYNNIKI